MKRMIDCDKIHVNNQGKVEIKDAKFTNAIELPAGQSAKKIYYHPIFVDARLAEQTYVAANTRILFSVVILNNDPTPFTTSTLGNTLFSFDRINPFISNSIVLVNENTFYPISAAKSSDKMYLIGYDSSGTLHSEQTNQIRLDNASINYVFDSVNAIN